MRLLLSLSLLSLVRGFTSTTSPALRPDDRTYDRRRRLRASPPAPARILPPPLASKSDERDDEQHHDDGPVTKEMFLRDMLADPKVRRKRWNGRYRTMDNRDRLPFVVQVSTPDPYTSNEEMKREARKLTRKARSGKDGKKGGTGGPTVRRNLVGMDRVRRDGISSSIYSRTSDGTLHRVLGEFTLDKSTNCGDLIEVGDQEFEVQKARCQYKYAGGKRFVMVRKILEVKEVTRIAEENYLKRQFKRSGSDDDGALPALE